MSIYRAYEPTSINPKPEATKHYHISDVISPVFGVDAPRCRSLGYDRFGCRWVNRVSGSRFRSVERLRAQGINAGSRPSVRMQLQ